MTALGTKIYTKIYGEYVGDDEFGNKYYKSSKKEGLHIGLAKKERRWVNYNGRAEPSKVPPYWHGWLHFSSDDIPTDKDKDKSYKWQKDHVPNLTGTEFAYFPSGDKRGGSKRESATGDYQAWKP